MLISISVLLLLVKNVSILAIVV